MPPPAGEPVPYPANLPRRRSYKNIGVTPDVPGWDQPGEMVPDGHPARRRGSYDSKVSSVLRTSAEVSMSTVGTSNQTWKRTLKLV
jgi:hypothetical protein